MTPVAIRALRVVIVAAVCASAGAAADGALAASSLHTSTAFGASILVVGDSTSATIQIDNTNQTSGQSALGFVDSLPTGLTVASPSNLGNTCGGNAVASSGSVSLTGGTLPRAAVCEVTFDVKAVATGVQSDVVTPSASGGPGDTGSAQLLVTAVASLTGGDPVTELKGGQVNGFTADPHPDAIASGPDGHVWFTENLGSGAVARVNDDHTVTEFRGGVTSGFTAQVQPSGITTGPDGNIWFAESDRGLARLNGNGTVTEFPAGSTPGFSAGLDPDGPTAGPDGNVWFAEFLNPGAVARVNGNSTVTELTGGVTSGFTANREPRDVTTGSDGRVWFTESASPGAVGRVNADGTVTEFTGGVTPGFTANQQPWDLTVGPDGHIWFTEQGPYEAGGAIARINDDGTVTEFAAGTTPGFTAGSGPSAIAAGPDGNVWFTETTGPGAVARLNSDGTVSEFTGGVTPGLTPFDVPVSITTGPDGYVWFTEDASPGVVGRIAPRSPGVLTGTAAAVSGTSATLQGTVNADGVDVSNCHFEYGTTTSYGASVHCAQAVGSGTGTVAVSATVQGLDPAHGYNFRLVATNAAATNVGGNQGFSTLAIPVVVTGAPGNIGETTATLVGTVNPEARAITDCHFDYGPTTAYGSTAACGQSAGGGFAPVAVSSIVSGLQPNTVYHYRLVATNAAGTNSGHDQEFTTLASGAAGEPSVTTGTAGDVTSTAATLHGTVNPQGDQTSYRFEYGTSTAYGMHAPAADGSAGADGSAHQEDQAIAGLTSSTTYHFRIVATNSHGTSAGADQTFTTPAAAPPALSGLAIRPARFRTGRGATISYRDSEAAITRFTIRRAHARVVGGFQHSDVAGPNTFRFSGRLSGKRLRPGSYTLSAIASSAGATGNPVSVHFRVGRSQRR